MRKDRIVSLRVSEEEYQKLNEGANKSHNGKISDYMRDKLFSEPVPHISWTTPTMTAAAAPSNVVWYNIGKGYNA